MNLTYRMRKKHPVRRGILENIGFPRTCNSLVCIKVSLDLIWAAQLQWTWAKHQAP
jgi:hypothetical protein